MVSACAIPLQKTHSIVFEPRQVCYPWHRWYGRSVLTRKAGGAHADVAYFCKLPEAPLDAMLVETRSGCSMRPIARRCVFGNGLMSMRDAAHSEELDSRTTCLREGSGDTTAAIRQAGDGDTDDDDLKSKSDETAGAVGQRLTVPLWSDLTQPTRVEVVRLLAHLLVARSGEQSSVRSPRAGRAR